MMVCIVMCSQPTAKLHNLTVLIVNQIARSPARESYLYSELKKMITNFGSLWLKSLIHCDIEIYVMIKRILFPVLRYTIRVIFFCLQISPRFVITKRTLYVDPMHWAQKFPFRCKTGETNWHQSWTTWSTLHRPDKFGTCSKCLSLDCMHRMFESSELSSMSFRCLFGLLRCDSYSDSNNSLIAPYATLSLRYQFKNSCLLRFQISVSSMSLLCIYGWCVWSAYLVRSVRFYRTMHFKFGFTSFLLQSGIYIGSMY